MNNRKTFATKGVQTDSVDHVLASNPKKSLHVSSRANALNRSASSQSSNTSSALRSLGDLDAYTYSVASFLDSPRHISACPSITPRHVPNYGQLACKRPSHVASIDRRIASLPETSPPHRISQTQDMVRLVSMPEQLRALRSGDGFKQYLDYAEALEISLDSNSHPENPGIDYTNFSRIPSTPSPPESPESVMIVGNDTNVPQTFLRRQSSVGAEDDGGWIPWECSPPKPIPALHGPPSLPYARCPSGAEGIIVESEDLSRMVWGLDSNNSHQSQAKNQSTGTQPRQPLRPLNPMPFPRNPDGAIYNRYGQNGIDFSCVGAQAPLSNNGPPSLAGSDYLGGQQRFRDDVRNEKGGFFESVGGDSPIQLYPGSSGLPSSGKNLRKTGLGIDLWRGAQENDPFLYSASVDGRAVYHIQTYDEYRQRSGIPTPPNTEPSQWSPLFRPPLLASTPMVHCTQLRPSHIVDSPQPQLQPGRLPPLPTHRTKEQMFLPTAPGHGPARASGSHHVVTPPQMPDTTATNDPNFEGHNLAQSFLQLCSVHNEPIPPLSDSPDLGRNFVQQQPRSIPLVRLIQRRLSSVVEEGVVVDKDTRAEPAKPVLTAFKEGMDRLGPGLDNLAASERVWLQGPTANVVPGLSPGSSTDDTKRTYETPCHPSRYYERGAWSMGDRVQKTTDITTSDFGASEENNGIPRKANTKQKKSYKKKKHTR